MRPEPRARGAGSWVEATQTSDKINLIKISPRSITTMRLPPLVAEIVAGYVGGSAKVLALYPLDTVTTLREIGIRQARRPCLQYYAGCSLTLLAAAPYAMVFHTVLWLCERQLGQIFATVPLKLISSAAASIVASVIGVPCECLKHRLQLRVRGYSTLMQAFRSILRTEGFAGFYSGFSSTIVRNVPYNALHFASFEICKSILLTHLAMPAGARDMISGSIAGALTALLTTPLDVINTHLQTQAVSASLIGAAQNVTLCSNPVDALSVILDRGGPAALMRGAPVRMAQYAPSAIIFFVVYEAVRRQLIH